MPPRAGPGGLGRGPARDPHPPIQDDALGGGGRRRRGRPRAGRLVVRATSGTAPGERITLTLELAGGTLAAPVDVLPLGEVAARATATAAAGS
jgi:hypothetical protein